MSSELPKTIAKYNEAQERNTRYEGGGMDTTLHSPCPFCCAPNFHSYQVLGVYKENGKEIECANCGYAHKVEIIDSGSTVAIRFPQTKGKNLLEYLNSIK